VRRELEQSLGILVRVRLVEPGSLGEHGNRLGRIVDERQNE
jgi:hypothetical protein